MDYTAAFIYQSYEDIFKNAKIFLIYQYLWDHSGDWTFVIFIELQSFD